MRVLFGYLSWLDNYWCVVGRGCRTNTIRTPIEFWVLARCHVNLYLCQRRRPYCHRRGGWPWMDFCNQLWKLRPMRAHCTSFRQQSRGACHCETCFLNWAASFLLASHLHKHTVVAVIVHHVHQSCHRQVPWTHVSHYTSGILSTYN